jgi:uncharacterized RDD family membrane protein YckC/type II secretory pathway pseudopilin PulG
VDGAVNGAVAATPAIDPDTVVYAGFWRRFAALFLDQLILGVAFYALFFIVLLMVGLGAGLEALAHADKDPPAWLAVAWLLPTLGYYLGAAFYYALQESSKHQATLGKRALGIKVTDDRGQRLRFAHALGRWFAASLSYLTLDIGFMMAGFTERKRALHDMVAGTLVVDQWAWTAHPERQQRGASGCLIAVIAAAILMVVVAVMGILAAIAIPAYQDYTLRANVSAAIAAGQALQPAIAEFRDQEGRCPVQDDGEAGLQPPEAYAGPKVERIDVGVLSDAADGDDGDDETATTPTSLDARWIHMSNTLKALEDKTHPERCGIEITLRGNPQLNGKRVWLEYDQAAQTWSCRSELPDPRLPASCRG